MKNILSIYRPQVIGNIVYFKWQSTYSNIVKSAANSGYIDYDAVDISQVPLQVHYNSIIGLLLNHLRGLDMQTIVITQDEVNLDIVNFWLSYHELNNVVFANTTKQSIAERNANVEIGGGCGILYGGGKDSSYALYSLMNNKAIKKISLISFVIPEIGVNINELEKRRDENMLKPTKEIFKDIDIIKIRTNLRGIISGYHLDLYLAPIGVLIYLGYFRYITFSYEYCHYYYKVGINNKYGFKRSQQSFMKAMSEFYTSLFNKVDIFNANEHMSEMSSFYYLYKKNPLFYKQIVMCEAVADKSVKYCCNCTKCAEFVLYCMYYDIKQDDIDVEWFFAKSPYILKIINKLKENSNLKYFAELDFILHFDSFMFCLSKLSDFKFKTDDANKNFKILLNRYGNNQHLSNPDAFYPKVMYNTYPKELIDYAFMDIKDIINQDEPPFSMHLGNEICYFNQKNQPEFIHYANKENVNIYDLITSSDNYKPLFNNSYTKAYIKSCNLTLNKLLDEDIVLDNSNSYIDIYIKKNPPMKTDGYLLEANLMSNWSYNLLHLDIINASNELNKRFYLYLNNEAIDMSKRYHGIKIIDKTFTLKLEVKNDLEKWRWGEAARIIISDILSFKSKQLLSNFGFEYKNIV